MVIFMTFMWISSRFRYGYPILDESLESFKTKRVYKYFFNIISINHNWQEGPKYSELFVEGFLEPLWSFDLVTLYLISF